MTQIWSIVVDPAKKLPTLKLEDDKADIGFEWEMEIEECKRLSDSLRNAAVIAEMMTK